VYVAAIAPLFSIRTIARAIFEFWIWQGVIDGSRGVVPAALYSTASYGVIDGPNSMTASGVIAQSRPAVGSATYTWSRTAVPPALMMDGQRRSTDYSTASREVTDLTEQRYHTNDAFWIQSDIDVAPLFSFETKILRTTARPECEVTDALTSIVLAKTYSRQSHPFQL